MVIVHIQLGTGNQLFQYAFARALAEKRNDVYIDQSQYANLRFGRSKLDDIRDYTLNQFCVGLAEAPKEVLAKYNYLHNDSLLNKVKLFLSNNNIGDYRYIKDKQNSYRKEMVNLPTNCYVEGWFQDEMYFKHIREILLKELIPAEMEVPTELLNGVSNCESVAIHVRRGDYLYNGMALDSTYYNMAIEEIKKSMPHAVFYVFSDDFRWVKRNLNLGDNCRFVNEDRSFNEANEIYLMSKCGAQIISNSTFSWWGAWLNTNPKKIVISPKIWFDTQTSIIPSEWTVLV